MGFFGGSSSDTPQADVDSRQVAELTARVTQLEAAVARLEARLEAPHAPAAGDGAVAPASPPSDPAWLVEVRSLLARGKKIQAIKVYREGTGAGLKEAKDAVEAMEWSRS
jgi:ribosomal protein L7/L12